MSSPEIRYHRSIVSMESDLALQVPGNQSARVTAGVGTRLVFRITLAIGGFRPPKVFTATRPFRPMKSRLKPTAIYTTADGLSGDHVFRLTKIHAATWIGTISPGGKLPALAPRDE